MFLQEHFDMHICMYKCVNNDVRPRFLGVRFISVRGGGTWVSSSDDELFASCAGTMAGAFSFAPLGLDPLLLLTHALRRGLHSPAASRLHALIAPRLVFPACTMTTTNFDHRR